MLIKGIAVEISEIAGKHNVLPGKKENPVVTLMILMTTE